MLNLQVARLGSSRIRDRIALDAGFVELEVEHCARLATRREHQGRAAVHPRRGAARARHVPQRGLRVGGRSLDRTASFPDRPWMPNGARCRHPQGPI
jgi:hypothetical protein